MTTLADRISRPTTRRSASRKAPIRPKGRRLASSAASSSAFDPAKAAIAADVMTVLAAFGLTD